MDKIEIGVVRLSSSLSLSDEMLRKDGDAFLESINRSGYLSFVEPRKDDILTVFFVLTGGSEIYFKQCYQDYPEPYFILARKQNNSLAASLEIVTFLQKQGKRVYLLFEEVDKIELILARYATFFVARSTFSMGRLGVIGDPSDWLIASDVDPDELEDKWGIQLIDVPYGELLREIEKHEIDDDPRVAAIMSKDPGNEDLRASFEILHALREICHRYGLHGFTLRCFDLLQTYHQTACLGFGLLNDDGIIAGCEGDIPAMLTMWMIHCLFAKPSFMANPSDIDTVNRKVTYAHCTCPLTMCNEYRLDTHFESKMGVAIAGTFPKGKVTAIKIHPDLSKILAVEGRIVATPKDPQMCRTQIEVAFDQDIEAMAYAPFGNHLVFAFGELQSEAEAFFDYLG